MAELSAEEKEQIRSQLETIIAETITVTVPLHPVSRQGPPSHSQRMSSLSTIILASDAIREVLGIEVSPLSEAEHQELKGWKLHLKDHLRPPTRRRVVYKRGSRWFPGAQLYAWERGEATPLIRGIGIAPGTRKER